MSDFIDAVVLRNYLSELLLREFCSFFSVINIFCLIANKEPFITHIFQSVIFDGQT
jgi:hypothetical protein